MRSRNAKVVRWTIKTLSAMSRTTSKVSPNSGFSLLDPQPLQMTPHLTSPIVFSCESTPSDTSSLVLPPFGPLRLYRKDARVSQVAGRSHSKVHFSRRVFLRHIGCTNRITAGLGSKRMYAPRVRRSAFVLRSAIKIDFTWSRNVRIAVL